MNPRATRARSRRLEREAAIEPLAGQTIHILVAKCGQCNAIVSCRGRGPLSCKRLLRDKGWSKTLGIWECGQCAALVMGRER